MHRPRTSHANRLLGYPAAARLLLVNADDFGMCHAVNVAIMHALTDGIVTSCSLMVPCPWALHALTWLQATPTVPVGVHLTAVSEQPTYRWGPVLGRTEVPSLVDEAGYFFAESRIPDLLDRVDVAELEREFRTQIERVVTAGVQPLHLDSHCGMHVRRDDIFDMTLALAREFGLALRVYDQPYIERLHHQGVPTNDYPVLDSYDLDPAEKAAHYAQLLHSLPVGLSEWAVHPGLGNAELQAIMPDWWPVRQTDYAFVMSPAAREIVQQEGIMLVDYAAVRDVWNGQVRG